MTDAPHPLANTAEKAAEALWVECRELTKTACIARLSLALAQARRETWGAAAKAFDEASNNNESFRRMLGQSKTFGEWCRQQAQEKP